MDYKKAIIWGHGFNKYHTQSHIHHGYFLGFKGMGFDTYWFDDSSDVTSVDFSGCIFFTEGQVDRKIPLIKSATYLLHHCDETKYLNSGAKVLNICNYVKFCAEGKSHNYLGNTVRKLDNFTYFDDAARGLYQPWATDLLPAEIDTNNVCLYDKKRNSINYVGLVWPENIQQLTKFKSACSDNNKDFRTHMNIIYPADNRNLVRSSYISPDFRGEWHKECGYIPCRILKNISYGVLTGTNSLHVKELFSDFVAYSDNEYDLFCETERLYACADKNKISDAMLYIKENHTFFTRIKNILKVLEWIN